MPSAASPISVAMSSPGSISGMPPRAKTVIIG
jgi:hypothetical protein